MSTELTYLDNNATTAPLPAVVEAMHEALAEAWGNPSSLHGAGERARQIVDAARETMAELIGARSSEIVFTSGATESINTALKGAIAAAREETPRILITAVEHEAVIEVAQELEARGVSVETLPVDAEGALDLEALDRALETPTTIVSLMLANNETGVIFPVDEVVRRAHAKGAAVHVDAVQCVGKRPISVEELGVDFLSLSAHKFHGPKGIGILYVRRGARYRPLVTGASHEGGRRGGTENVACIAGMAAAARHMMQGISERRAHLSKLGQRLEKGLLAIERTRLNGPAEGRMPGTVNVSFEGIEGSAIVLTAAREGICLSAGSACSAAEFGGSHVLEAMKTPFSYLYGAVRFSCCETTTEAEVDRAIEVVGRAVAYLREMNPSGRSAEA